MILNVNQIREWDAFTIAHEPINSIDLMERAALACFNWLKKMNFVSKSFQVFCGTGNNGGDGLALCRMLLNAGVEVEIYIIKSEALGTNDFQKNLSRWKNECKREINWIKDIADFPKIKTDGFIIDALYGSGLNRPITGISASLINYLNSFSNTLIAIDLPSGLLADGFSSDYNGIRATYTLTFQVPKFSFFLVENEQFIGEVIVLDIELHRDYLQHVDTLFNQIDTDLVKNIFRPRNKNSHKGHFGHALLLAGSYGKTGAALLAGSACMHGGVGLLTIGSPGCSLEILQIGLPEAMVITDDSSEKLTNLSPKYSNYQAVGIGPGLGTHGSTKKWFLKQLKKIHCPIVLDADALNIIGLEKKWKLIPPNCVLTPHPKEFDRLFGESQSHFERIQKAIQNAKDYSCIIVLKGHHTLIAGPDGRSWLNTTGNAGMATGGSGDVLTGIITGLLAQGYTNLDAALLGVWLHGKAGDLACKSYSQEALIARNIFEFLGKAFQSIHN